MFEADKVFHLNVRMHILIQKDSSRRVRHNRIFFFLKCWNPRIPTQYSIESFTSETNKCDEHFFGSSRAKMDIAGIFSALDENSKIALDWREIFLNVTYICIKHWRRMPQFWWIRQEEVYSQQRTMKNTPRGYFPWIWYEFFASNAKSAHICR